MADASSRASSHIPIPAKPAIPTIWQALFVTSAVQSSLHKKRFIFQLHKGNGSLPYPETWVKVKICGIAFHSPRFDAPGRPFLRPLVDVTMAADDVGELILQSQAYSVDAPIIQMISQEFRILLLFVPNFGPRAHAAFGPE